MLIRERSFWRREVLGTGEGLGDGVRVRGSGLALRVQVVTNNRERLGFQEGLRERVLWDMIGYF